MAHALILGRTESGKSTLAKLIAKSLRSRGRRVLLHDPCADNKFPADFRFLDMNGLGERARVERSAHVFIDESSAAFDDGRNLDHSWLATRSRHWGHSCYFIGQRAPQVPKTMRDQCSTLFLFSSSVSDGIIHADEWGRDELRGCNTLKQFEFFKVDRAQNLQRMRIVNYREIQLVRDE